MIIAKKKNNKYQDLQTHTNWVLEVVFNSISYITIKNLSNYTNYPQEKIIDLLFFSAYFHDIGKATEEFQNTILYDTQSFHSYYGASLFYLDENFLFEENSLLFFTILTHHSLMPYSKEAKNFRFLDETKDFFYDYKKVYKNFFNKECKYDFDFESETFNLTHMEEDLKEIQNYDKFRVLYNYISGILTKADWLASAKFNEIDSNLYIKKQPLKFPFNLKEFQTKLSVSNNSVLVEIPTGEGKTEGSLLWAINNVIDKNTKIIYTLPTSTTSNKLFERINKLFNNQVGLIHSNAKVYLEKKYEKENGLVDDFFRNEFLFIKNFAKPITVSTLDSLLKSFINISRFNIISSNFYNSVVIIDEVHSYDFKLLGFLKRFLELCDELNVKVCLMSASIPNKIKNLLGLNRYKLITQQDLFLKKANEIFKNNFYIEDDIDFIIDTYKKNKKVLIIKNTIKGATDIYQKLKSKNIDVILYHSTFKKIDRNKKEELIFEKLESNKPFILVATQVVEISLDIDFEVMFSDIAPIDSLIQRFGRVNRKKTKKGKIYLYKVKNPKPYEEDIIDFSFEVIEDGYFELNTYNKWLNIVYDKLFDTKIIKNKIDRLFYESYDKYNKTLKKLFGIYQSKDNYDLRDIEMSKIDFLLYDDYISDKIEYEYTISLPYYFNKFEHKIDREDIYYPILKLDYSFEDGIKIEEEEKFGFI